MEDFSNLETTKLMEQLDALKMMEQELKDQTGAVRKSINDLAFNSEDLVNEQPVPFDMIQEEEEEDEDDDSMITKRPHTEGTMEEENGV